MLTSLPCPGRCGPMGRVLRPERASGEGAETALVEGPESALAASSLSAETVEPWQTIELGDLAITALPAGMDPNQAAVAASLLGARLAVPIHYGPLHETPNYIQAEDPGASFERAGAELGVSVRVLGPGERLSVEPTESAAGPRA